MDIKRFLLIALWMGIASMLPGVSFAGELDDFEKAATRKKDTRSEKDDKHKHGHDRYDDSHGLLGDILSSFFTGSVEPVDVAPTSAPVPPGPVVTDRPSRTNDPPDRFSFGVDVNYLLFNGGVSGLDTRVGAGYGPICFQYHTTHFKEDSPRDDMTLSYTHVFYRVFAASDFELSIGIGSIRLEGEDVNNGLSGVLQIIMHYSPEWEVRVIPAWNTISGNEIKDNDFSAAYVHRRYSFRLGYRIIQAHEQVLEGPYAGISFRY